MTETPPAQIEGLFEIHITVSMDDLVDFQFYCSEKKYKIILACSKYGSNPQQLMLSSWKTGVETDAIKAAKTMAKELESLGIKVLRTKVEAVASNDNVPRKGTRFGEKGACHHYRRAEEEYFEYHIKVDIDKPAEYDVLADAARPIGAHLSFNGMRRDKITPIVTLRVRGVGREGADAVKDEMFELMKRAGFYSHNQIQKEYSVYDDNPGLDSGWLEPSGLAANLKKFFA